MFQRTVRRFCINRTEGAAPIVSLCQRMIPNDLFRAFQKPQRKTNC
jgi:hypothetical protein